MARQHAPARRNRRRKKTNNWMLLAPNPTPFPGVRFLLPPRTGTRISLADPRNPCLEPWLLIRDAIKLIMTRRDMGPETAEAKLREACLSGKVRSRYLLPYTDAGGKKFLRFCSLPKQAWTPWTNIGSESGTLHNLDLGTVRHVEISDVDLNAWLARPRRGPQAGVMARYADADRALFDALGFLIREQELSVEEAARYLALEGKVSGRGTPENRAKRLARLYRKELRRLP
jgi:hypothetical protein